MKKTLSIVLAVLTVLSVFSFTAVAADAPAIADLKSTFDGVKITWESVEDAVAYIIYRDGNIIDTTKKCEYLDATVEEGVEYSYALAIQTKDSIIGEPCEAQVIAYIRPNCNHKGAKYVVDYPATVYAPGQKHKHCSTCGLDYSVKAIKQLICAAPKVKSVTNETTGIYLKWGVVDGADSYRVYRSANGGKYTKIATIKTTSYNDKTVKSGVKYKYVVRAANEVGASEYTSDDVYTIIRSAAPTKLSVENKASYIHFEWNKISNASGYRVYRKTVGQGGWKYIGSVKTTYFNDKTAEAGVDYKYTVRAVVNKTLSDYVSGVSIRRLENPKLVGTKSAKDGIYVEFKQVDGANGYNVYRKIGNGSWKKLGVIDNTKSTIYLDVSAEKGVKYTYTVRGYYKTNSATSISSYNSKGVTCTDKY